ncbi:MAG: hypothetical protein HZA81_00740 [Candidatus Taylorbacteria bacterium]|nr:hypothetical protein [Candidatus Taylorbacteria bacterium]
MKVIPFILAFVITLLAQIFIPRQHLLKVSATLAVMILLVAIGIVAGRRYGWIKSR